MKLAIITDIHHSTGGSDDFDVRSAVETFVTRANESGVDALVDLGDRIDDVSRAADFAATEQLAGIFKRFAGPRVHLLGNHDVVNLTDADHEALLGQSPESQVYTFGDARLIAWYPSVLLDRRIGFPPATAQLEWLVAALNADDRPAIIATHIPVSGASMVGNYYFENNADFATYPDHAAIRTAVEETGRAAMWISGHVHWNSISTVGNVRHLTVQSASERFTTMPHPAGAFTDLEIGEGTARIRVLGRDPIEVTLPFVASGEHRWPAPRPRVSRS